ncbi:unnamed protein product [Macrosiphum euphorbiae]|uniref:DUF5641 domain-containing protein n=1 Tax=Macrosiphum euphorbiae TaxID=13131 RepID=A0AAV0Y7N0_9HEMI|nr:unnamed protein product [Macrosiphum euphorbiae]
MEATDYSALTPGHFLLGKAPMSLPEVDIPEPTPTNRLTRWNRIQKMQQSFWKQWSQDYLATLQQRNKWTTPQPNLQVHDLVLLKKENMARGAPQSCRPLRASCHTEDKGFGAKASY